MPKVRPFYIGSGATAVYAVLHPAEESRRAGKPAVLVCPPWGWDDVASYRVRGQWASRLAAAGFPTLRFDLPATGNSAGDVDDAAIPSGWVAATLASAGWLADAEGMGAGVAAIGIGLGGLLALAAVAAGAPIAALALWGAPGRGKRLVREIQAFSQMQPWMGEGESAGGFDPGVPEGWLEAGGFGLSPATLGELRAMAPELHASSSLTRALVLGRDGVGADPASIKALEAAGVKVEQDDGQGWGSLVSHPEEAAFPERTAAEVERWLTAAPAVPIEPRPAPDSSATLELDIGGRDVHETPLLLEEPWGRTIGILAAPPSGSAEVCAVFLNAGAVRSVGPNRMWAEAARRWAAAGVPSLRIDLEGIGDADGEASGELRLGDFYSGRYGAQVRALLDDLEGRGLGRRFILVGLCSGGYWAFRTAVEDPRVAACLQVNAGALRWVDDLPQRREAHRASRALEGRWWRKLLKGEIEPGRIVRLLTSLLLEGLTASRRLLGRALGRRTRSLEDEIEADLDVLGDRGTRVVLAFSADEPLGEEVERLRLPQRAARWPNIEFAELPGNDHTLRPFAAQRAAGELLDRELARFTAAPSTPR